MLLSRVARIVQRVGQTSKNCGVIGAARHYSSAAPKESPEDFDNRFITFFEQPGLDDWWLRKGLWELHSADVVPETKVSEAALRAIRRLGDFALAVRYLEAIRYKTGLHEKQVYPYVIQELKPILNELGIPTLEEMGYDKPELWWPYPVESYVAEYDDVTVPNYGKKMGIFHPQAFDPRLYDYQKSGVADLATCQKMWNKP